MLRATPFASGIAVVVIALSMLVPAPLRAQSLPDCWELTGAALRHRVASAHPPYVAYDQVMVLTSEGEATIRSTASIIYRDDGVARVSDDLDSRIPYVTQHLAPGPPELGPYGKRRELWTPQALLPDNGLREIGRVHANNPNGITCRTQSRELYKDHDTYHLTFSSTTRDRPTLRALWIDVANYEIWKVVISGYILPGLIPDIREPELTDYELEIGSVGPYMIVNHVTWRYTYREHSQTAVLFGEYYFRDFHFPRTLPSELFSYSGK